MGVILNDLQLKYKKMKKIILTALIALVATFCFAANSSKTEIAPIQKTIAIENDNEYKKIYPTGSMTITDCNGDVWEVTYSCNYNCSTWDIIGAVEAWYTETTGCESGGSGEFN